MTISPFLIYLAGAADNLRGLFFAVSATSVLVILASVIYCDLERIKNRLWKPATVAAVTSAILFALIPSTKTVSIMIVAPALVNSRVIQRDVPELYEVAKEALRESIQKKEGED